MLRALCLLLLCFACPAQRIEPYNLELHDNVFSWLVRWNYRWAIVLMWRPVKASPVLTLHTVGRPLTLTIEQIGFLHLPEWTGQCPTRIERGPPFATPLYVWPTLAANPSIHLNSHPVVLFTPGGYSVSYGDYFGAVPCQLGTVTALGPHWVGALLLVDGL